MKLQSLIAAAAALALATSAAAGNLVHPRISSIPTNGFKEVRAGELLVKIRGAAPRELGPNPLFHNLELRSYATPEQVRRISLEVPGAQFVKGLTHGGWTLWTIPMTIDPFAAAGALKSDPDVVCAEPVFRVFPMLVKPNDTDWNVQETDTNLTTTGFLRLWHLLDLNAVSDESSATISSGGWTRYPNQWFTSGDGHRQPLIAIVDTGCDMTHPDFKNSGGTSTDSAHGGQLNYAMSQQFVDGDIVTSGGVTDDTNGHGTHVAGIAVASGNNQGVDSYAHGVIGIGYNSQAMILRVFDAADTGDDMTAATAMEYAADNGADIINLSLGTGYYSQVFQDAVTYCWQKGSLVVCAGNESGNGGGPLGPIYPASCSGALGVIANAAGLTPASYTGSGYYASVAAPGGDATVDLTTGDFSFQYVFSTATEHSCTLSLEGLTPPYTLDYTYLTGTSMATPMVSGAAGLYYGANNLHQADGFSNVKAYQAIEATAMGTNGIEFGSWDETQGYGSLDVDGLLNGAVPNPRGATVGSAMGIIYVGGTPVPNVRVVATPLSFLHKPYQTTSKNDGTYRFDHLPPGRYQITVSPFGLKKTKVLVVSAGADFPGFDFFCGPSIGDFTPPIIPKFNLIASTSTSLTFDQWAYDTMTGVDSVMASIGTTPLGGNIMPPLTIAPGVRIAQLTTAAALPSQYFVTFLYRNGEFVPSRGYLAVQLPTDDAFVADGSSSGTNFNLSHLDVQSSATVGSNRITYLKFNLAGVGANIGSAQLVLTGGDSGATLATAVQTGAYGTSSASWSESTLTWNNEPAIVGSPADTQPVYGTGTFTWNVASLVAAAKAANQTTLTIALKATNNTTTTASFTSKEGASGTPHLLVTSHD